MTRAQLLTHEENLEIDLEDAYSDLTRAEENVYELEAELREVRRKLEWPDA